MARSLAPYDVFGFLGQMHDSRLAVLRDGDRQHANAEVDLILPQRKVIGLAQTREDREPEHIDFLTIELLH